MSEAELLIPVPSAQQVIDWFGRWPSFHDAEVVRIVLNRSGRSELVVHAFNMTSKVNSHGYYVTEKHALLTFYLDGILNADLDGFNHQNVLNSLHISTEDKAIRIDLEGIYGVAGHITANSIEIKVDPGIPEGSNYAPASGGEVSV
jgi:hypothetical protein